MAKNDPAFKVRLPPELKRQIEALADIERRSQTGQIVFLLEQAVRAQQSTKTAA